MMEGVAELARLLASLGPVLPVRQYSGKGSDIRVTYTAMNLDGLVRAVADGRAEECDLYLGNFDCAEEAPSKEFDDHFQRCCRETMGATEETLDALYGYRRQELASPSKTPSASLWVGPPGHVEPLHYDTHANIHVAIVGRKRWSLLRPTLRNFRLARPLWRRRRRRQKDKKEEEEQDDAQGQEAGEALDANFASRQFEDCGVTSSPAALEVVLEPGEMLYVPPLWWHQVAGLPAQGKERVPRDGAARDQDPSAAPELLAVLPKLVVSLNMFLEGGKSAGGRRSLIEAWQVLRLKMQDG